MIHDIRKAVQYFGMSGRKVKCPIARQLVDEVLAEIPEWDDCIVDSRLSMLKPGWYPCIPGWHYDEVKRDPDGSLNWERNAAKTHYIMVIDQGTGSLTEIAHSEVYRFPKVSNYTELNQWMESNPDRYNTFTIDSGGIYILDCNTPHRGTPATGSGWRYFIRATVGTQREYANEIRTQTQVYIPTVNVGW